METEIELFSKESVPVVPNEVVAEDLNNNKPEKVGETASLKNGLTSGTSIHPYDGQGKKESVEDSLFGTDLFGESMAPKKDGALAKRFLIPPFSILNAREGEWQNRKRAWIALGIKSELGRGGEAATGGSPEPLARLRSGGQSIMNKSQEEIDADKSTGIMMSKKANANPGGSLMPAADYSKGQRGDSTGKAISDEQLNVSLTYTGITGKFDVYRVANVEREETQVSGTSIFDPVLCELCYKWFIPTGGSILDPFAGGSVRGIVASVLGHDYTGIDLSEQQIRANEKQAETICKDKRPLWIIGDSRNMMALLDDGTGCPKKDFIFACPPYYDLEVYSEDKRDLSVCSYKEFCVAYKQIIKSATEVLKPNRFAVYVIGDVRDEKGFYRGLPQLTISAFVEAGMKLYNSAILITALCSLPIRCGKQFSSGRKLGNTHQHVLVFFKGDPRKIKEEFPRLQSEEQL